MKFYLSSYKIGNSEEKLKKMFSQENLKIDYIPNAGDEHETILEKRKIEISEKNFRDIKSLEKIGLHPEILDLRKYFHTPEKLSEKLSKFSGVFVSGGNTFVLRRAYKLSGFDTWIQKNIASDFVYAGYSAGCCILSPSLKGLKIVDEPEKNPYEEDFSEIIWEGLGVLNYSFLPHYDSNHHESADIEKEVKYAIKNKIPFKAFRDGEVEIFEIKP